jgi:hypothetical protein
MEHHSHDPARGCGIVLVWGIVAVVGWGLLFAFIFLPLLYALPLAALAIGATLRLGYVAGR